MTTYMVIADYPGSRYNIGQIIEENDGCAEYDAPNNFEKYPAIFERIEPVKKELGFVSGPYGFPLGYFGN